MSEEAETEEEPSIEEILDSIRQIISDDDEEEAVAEEPAEEAAPEPEPAEEAAPEPEPEAEPEPEVAAEPEPEPEVEAAPEPEAEPEPEPKPEPEAEPEPEEEVIDLIDVVEEEPVIDIEESPPPADEELSDIISPLSETVALGAFEELAQKAKIDKSGQVTVEDIVRTEIRPMLRAWIDEHLPPMMERLLQDELEKIAKRALEE